MTYNTGPLYREKVGINFVYFRLKKINCIVHYRIMILANGNQGFQPTHLYIEKQTHGEHVNEYGIFLNEISYSAM